MRTPRRLVSIVLTLLLFLPPASTARGQPEAPDLVGGAPIYTVLSVDAVGPFALDAFGLTGGPR